MGKKSFCACAAVSLVICGGANAGFLEFGHAGVQGEPQVLNHRMPDDPVGHSARATFNFTRGQLEITLTNTSTYAPRSDGSRGPDSGNVSWLTGLFFNIEGGRITGGGSASGPMVWAERGGGFTPLDQTQADPGAFWAFRDNLTPSDFGGFADLFGGGEQQYGLGAAGFDIFGPHDILEPEGNHPGENNPPAGSGGGILPGVQGLELPNGHRDRAYVDETIVFVFDFEFFDDEVIPVFSDVAFVWGTDLAQGLVVLIPLPAALPMGLAGLAGVAFLRRRAVRRAKRAA